MKGFIYGMIRSGGFSWATTHQIEIHSMIAIRSTQCLHPSSGYLVKKCGRKKAKKRRE